MAILFWESLLLYLFDEKPFQYLNTFFDKNTTLLNLENPQLLGAYINFEVILQDLVRI